MTKNSKNLPAITRGGPVGYYSNMYIIKFCTDYYYLPC